MKKTSTPAPRNRTLRLSASETKRLHKDLIYSGTLKLENKILLGDTFLILKTLPDQFIDLIIADPPYNINKVFSDITFRKKSDSDYEMWLESWIPEMRRILKPTGTFYFCCDYKTSPLVYNVCKKYFSVQNRISWEREKGRGAKTNWKNSVEDIWFFTKHPTNYRFNVDDVKVKRKVVAPYRTALGEPKDWKETKKGNFRMTHPSNFWSDITIPFWSMPENTEHPTQKSEKLLAKLVLASSKSGDLVFDPFLGSGTTAVVAKKLDRKFFGIEVDSKYATLALKRLELAETEKSIQGYQNGLFWERNSKPLK